MLKFFQTKTFQYFLPFMVVVVGGSFALREVAEVRYKYRKSVSYAIRREAEELGIEIKKSASLEEIYEDMKKNLNIDDWENVRVPRPWDE